MGKKKTAARLTASALAICLAAGGISTGTVRQAEAADLSESGWEEIQSIVGRYYGEWTDTSYAGAVSSYTPDTALLGNGDIGLSSGGDAETKTFYISKGDFWEYNGTQKAVGGYSIKEKEEPESNPNLAPMYKEVTSTPEDTWGLTSLGKAVAVSGEIQIVSTGYGWVSQPIQNNEPQWLRLEYEEPVTVKKYVLYHDGAIRPSEAKCNSRDWELQYSDDGQDWKTADTVADNSENITERVLDKAVTAKFFRIYITNPVQPEYDTSTDVRAKIAQWEMYEQDTAAEEEESDNLALNKPIKVSAEYTNPNAGEQLGTMLVDGDLQSKWCALEDKNIGTHWAILDLGEVKQIGYYRLHHAGTIGETEHNTVEYQLQYLPGTAETDWDTIETDDLAWSNMDHVTENTATVTSKEFDTPVETRYIRILVNKPAPGNGAVRLHELELYKEVQEEEPFYEKQDILNAEVVTDMPYGSGNIHMETFVSPEENLAVTKLVSKAEERVELQADLWGKADDGRRPVTVSGNEDGTVSVTRSTYNGTPSAEDSYTSKAAMTMMIIGAEAEASTERDRAILSFSLEPGAEAYVAVAVGGGGQTYNGAGELQNDAEPVSEAAGLLKSCDTIEEMQSVKAGHEAWWKDYWSASYIKLDTTDPELDAMLKYYYGAQYILGCTLRDGELAPGIMGIWCTTDSPMWNGHYQLNYNYNAPAYGAGSSNRAELNIPLFEQILEYEEEGRKNSESIEQLMKLETDGSGRGHGYVTQLLNEGRIDSEKGIEGGIFYPVGITPWGQTVCPGLYHNETLCAAYSAFPAIDYWQYTMDHEYLETKLYDYLKGCAVFYESWLEKDDNGQYNMYAGYHENSWGYNPAVELTTVWYLFDTIVDASETLGVDEDKRELWTDIRDNLAPQPTSEYNGKTVYALAEKSWNGSAYVEMTSPVPADGNAIPLESIGQCNRLGYFSTAEELQTARNTIDVFDGTDGWNQVNNFPRIFTMAVRARYDINQVVENFARVINTNMKPNLRISDPYHGIEKLGATESVNSMMMQTDKGMTKLFPNWYTDKDAKFVSLRAKGAFTVSAEYDGTAQEAKNVTITSEAGEDMTLVSPWEEGMTVKDAQGNIVETEKGAVPNWEDQENAAYTFATTEGETYTIEKGEAETEKPSKSTLEYFLDKAKEHQAAGDVDSCVESIQNLFTEAVAEGEAVMTDENATYEEIMNATVKLMKAIQALDMKAADKTDLGMAVELAKSIDLSDYVEAGQAEFQQALSDAEAILADGDAMQAETNEAWSALVDALGSLRLKADKSALEDLLNSLEELDLSPYTEESAAVFRTAFASARAVLADAALSVDEQKTVDDAVQALGDAREQLELKDGTGGDSSTGKEDSNTKDADGNIGNETGQNPDSGDYNEDDQPASGSADKKADIPKTGDEAVPVICFGMLIVTAAWVTVMIKFRRKRCE